MLGALTHTRITWALSPMMPQASDVTMGFPLVSMRLRALLMEGCATPSVTLFPAGTDLSSNIFLEYNTTKTRRANSCSLYHQQRNIISLLRFSLAI